MSFTALKSVVVHWVLWSGLSVAGSVFAASPAEFVDQATAAGIAEIESSRLAIQKSTSTDINSFAVEMIKDHTNANRHLSDLARQLDLKLAPQADVSRAAEGLMFRGEEGDDFDAAYIAHQIKAHEQVIELFTQQARETESPQLQTLIKDTLPKLEMHLDMARKLEMTHRLAE